jgi:hypothetical protein
MTIKPTDRVTDSELKFLQERFAESPAALQGEWDVAYGFVFDCHSQPLLEICGQSHLDAEYAVAAANLMPRVLAELFALRERVGVNK